MSVELFEAKITKVSDILCALNVLAWDARTKMPPGGVVARGKQMATLIGLAREIATGDELQRAIQGARLELNDEPHTNLKKMAVEHAAREIETLARIPARLIEAAADLKPRSQAAWAKARQDDDFQAFKPYFVQTLALRREMVEAIGYEEHPYDALIGLYEPGMTWKRLRGLYDELKGALSPLIEEAQKAVIRSEVLERRYPVDQQRAYSSAIAARLGFDFNRGRLDDAVHPFEVSFSRDDVRITGRFRETWLPGGIFPVWHEAGHGMYEQNIDERFTRTAFTIDFINLYAVGGFSYGAHESQSRLWENRVGRSYRFWELHFGELKKYFPQQLSDVSSDEFWKAINAARPSSIRGEADELTYDFHIMMRTEIEAALFMDEIRVEDLPDIWREKAKSYLGLDVTSDREGLLQDVQWASGTLGSFPTYTLGNIMASQFYASATQDVSVALGLDNGDYSPLKDWLTENIYRHGRSKSSSQLLLDATGEGLSTKAYISELTGKVRRLLA